ncbi:TPA: hypothetical protein ACH3X1_008511 [Trebouxia sp. C0004]
MFVRPSYLKLKDRILQLHQASGTNGDKTMIISGTPEIGKSYCALYMASYWFAQGTRVTYEFHDQDEATSIIWYHFPPNSGEGLRICLEQDVDHHVTGATDDDTVYIVDGGLPRIPGSSCWCYAFSSPQKSVYRQESSILPSYVPSPVDPRRAATVSGLSGHFQQHRRSKVGGTCI